LSQSERDFDRDTVRPRNKTQLALAAVLLLVPIVALLWVDTYAKAEPTLAGFPFFIWYQFLWVFLCSACTWTAYHLVQVGPARRPPSAHRATEGARSGKGSR